MKNPKSSIVLLTFNHFFDTTRPCLLSLINHTDLIENELIIVDNCSDDDTVKKIEEIISGKNLKIRLIKNSMNFGYAAGNNIGIKEARGDIIILLNNDTIVSSKWLINLSNLISNQSNLGMLGPVSNSVGNEQMIVIDGLNEINFEIKYNNALSQPVDLYHTDNLGFFCVAIKREVIDAVGLLDEKFGIGMFEDTDYCVRALEAGFQLAFTEKVFVYHSGSYSFKKLSSSDYTSLFKKNLEYFQKKHGKFKWGFSLILKNFMNVLAQQINSSNDSSLITSYNLRAKSFENLISVLTKIECMKVDNYNDIF